MTSWGDAYSRVMARTERRGACLLFIGPLNADGYGRVKDSGREKRAHRVVYERLVGPIPEGFQIDHLCKVRNCVRIEHLEAVTPRENLLRSPTWGGRNAAKESCPQGHPYDRVDRHGHRTCTTCRAAAQRRYRTKKSAVTAGATAA